MSIVGTRPPLISETNLYEPRHKAMACGAVVVSSDYEGIHEYGIEGVNCLLSPLRNPEALAQNVSKVFDDAELRYKISKQGRESLKAFDWKIAFDKFQKTIEQ